jgi:hypothetical protein
MRPVMLFAFSVAAAGCARSPDPQCFAQRRPQALNALEEVVLADAKARTLKECGAANRQCDIRLKRDRSGAFNVFVVYASVASDGTCIFLPGDDELHVYNGQGKYVERVPGM